MSLNAIASPAAFDPCPLVIFVRSLTVAKADSIECLYLVTRSLDPTGTGRTRWAVRWKPALNAFAITFAGRFPSAETY
jgi:hypothetical protein